MSAVTIASGPVQELIARLCRLQEKVCNEAIGHAGANDCICGEGGKWAAQNTWPAANDFWRSEGTAIDFIERAVEKEIRWHQAKAELLRMARDCVPPVARGWRGVKSLFPDGWDWP